VTPPSRDGRPRLVTTWFGVFVLEGDRVAAHRAFPLDLESLVVRARRRAEGQLTDEEADLLASWHGPGLVSRDRRFESRGVPFEVGSEPEIDPTAYGFDRRLERELALRLARNALRDSWDPSAHVEEAVRSVAELDDILNRMGERLHNWAARDRPLEEAPDREGLRHLANRLAAGGRDAESSAEPLAADPDLVAARAELARVYLSVEKLRGDLEAALERALPRRAPNVTALLGAPLAARLLSIAGGLDRLARLPSSTVQVLGAEKAFFEHLRGRAPPPRHGVLFLHPTLSSAPRRNRGKLARALAGKVAIAARLDREGTDINPALASAFERRVAQVASQPAGERRSRSRRARPTTST
jgi:nucleolar protein 56